MYLEQRALQSTNSRVTQRDFVYKTYLDQNIRTKLRAMTSNNLIRHRVARISLWATNLNKYIVLFQARHKHFF